MSKKPIKKVKPKAGKTKTKPQTTSQKNQKREQRRLENYNLLIEKGFDAKTARRYRDLSKDNITELVKTKIVKPIDEKRQRISKKFVGFEEKDTFFHLYNYVVRFQRFDGSFGHWTVSSDRYLTNAEVKRRCKEIYDKNYAEGNKALYPYQTDSDGRLSQPDMSTLEIVARIKGNKKKLLAIEKKNRKKGVK